MVTSPYDIQILQWEETPQKNWQTKRYTVDALREKKLPLNVIFGSTS